MTSNRRSDLSSRGDAQTHEAKCIPVDTMMFPASLASHETQTGSRKSSSPPGTQAGHFCKAPEERKRKWTVENVWSTPLPERPKPEDYDLLILGAINGSTFRSSRPV
jgi:hypothetical protein